MSRYIVYGAVVGFAAITATEQLEQLSKSAGFELPEVVKKFNKAVKSSTSISSNGGEPLTLATFGSTAFNAVGIKFGQVNKVVYQPYGFNSTTKEEEGAKSVALKSSPSTTSFVTSDNSSLNNLITQIQDHAAPHLSPLMEQVNNLKSQADLIVPASNFDSRAVGIKWNDGVRTFRKHVNAGVVVDKVNGILDGFNSSGEEKK
jgi:hypothetical protein